MFYIKKKNSKVVGRDCMAKTTRETGEQILVDNGAGKTNLGNRSEVVQPEQKVLWWDLYCLSCRRISKWSKNAINRSSAQLIKFLLDTTKRREFLQQPVEAIKKLRHQTWH